MKRDSYIFYRGFYEALKALPHEDGGKFVIALCEYALDGKEPECDGVAMALFKMAKPQIDKNNQRWENGKKGGRPTGQNETKTKPTANQNITKTEKAEPNVNVNVNVNALSNDKEIYARIKDAFNDTCLSLPEIRTVTDKRKNKLRARFKTFTEQDIINAFIAAERSDFLTGRGGKNWHATFDWIIDSDTHVARILEGQYDNRKAQGRVAQAVDRVNRALAEMEV